MKGAIIGDVIGSSYEFNNTFIYGFQMFTENTDFTDDTICTVAIADALMLNKDYTGYLRRWCRKYPNPTGAYGPSFKKWIFSDEIYSNNSYGNGALMRLSPIVLSNLSLQSAKFEAMNATKCSHAHPEALNCVNAFVEICDALKKNKQKELAFKIMSKYFGYDWKFIIPKKGIFEESCQGTLPLAVMLFYKSTSFEDAIRLAVSYGGDSDTLAAVVGTLAEIYYGVPDKLWGLVKEYLPQEFLDVVDRFYKYLR